MPDRPEFDGGELAGAVDEELERLPDRMRAAFVLCGLAGMTSAVALKNPIWRRRPGFGPCIEGAGMRGLQTL